VASRHGVAMVESGGQGSAWVIVNELLKSSRRGGDRSVKRK
jgi:hypothetical protein